MDGAARRSSASGWFRKLKAHGAAAETGFAQRRFAHNAHNGDGPKNYPMKSMAALAYEEKRARLIPHPRRRPQNARVPVRVFFGPEAFKLFDNLDAFRFDERSV